MAEIELGVLARQCLDRRIPCQDMLEYQTRMWPTGIGTGSGWTGVSLPRTPASN